ncbi:hypothetical protein F4V43_14260 [Paenibacillus spiritus]|uniref:Uncharacterized protein n=1 Tax=Paenibacillus spiritus TaxID=2496557 RepID=A0A5J5G282_9BACL|nr:hypothetical protein [Paenibacillus spiritus]KAA9001005.1 hypothetical protein F4V43_14260 [Paenibacillus spiritus]
MTDREQGREHPNPAERGRAATSGGSGGRTGGPRRGEGPVRESLQRRPSFRESSARETFDRESSDREPSDRELSGREAAGGRGRNRKKNRPAFWAGMTALLMLAVYLVTDGSTAGMEDVRSNGIGRGLSAGVQLASADSSAGLAPRDFDLKMKAGITSARVLVWDFAAEDGDVVTIKVNGTAVSENVGIFHKPVAVDVPVPCRIEVVGVKDGGGGITYGIKIPGAVSGSAYFNAAPVGSANTYTLTGQ